MCCRYCFTITCKHCKEYYCEDHYREHLAIESCGDLEDADEVPSNIPNPNVDAETL